MTVFIVQKQMFLDKSIGEFVIKFPDILKAERYGNLSVMLSPTDHPFDPVYIASEIQNAIADMTRDDYLLPVGNTTLVAIATAIVANHLEGEFKLLHWSARDNDYVVLNYHLFDK